MTTGLVRVTIDAPARRMDLTLPDRSPVAELLPGLVRRAGDALADEGVQDGGWMLRRPDGSPVTEASTLGAQRVRDGEVLHLVPRGTDWPELEYDDLAATVAAGAARTGRLWAPRHTRALGLAGAGAAVLLTLVAVPHSGPPWSAAALTAGGVAVLLLVAATVLSRALGDSAAGAALAAAGLPLAFAAGALALGGPPPTCGAGACPGLFGGALVFGAPQVLAGCAAVLVVSVVALVAVADRVAVFVGGLTASVLGGAAAWLAAGGAVDGAGAAASAAGVVLVFSPLFGPLAARLGRVPAPALPQTAADLVRDEPQPPRRKVYATVVRAEQFLTGLFGGAALVAAVAEAVLAADGRTSAVVLLAVLALGFCVRARLYPAVRQRLPLLVAGLCGFAGLAIGPLTTETGRPLTVAVPALLAAAAFAAVLGLVHSRRAPGARLGRYAELLEVLLVLACVPAVCAVLGLYELVRGLGG